MNKRIEPVSLDVDSFEVTRLKEEHRELVEALEELVCAEWMVSHDWGGDRKSIFNKAEAILEKVRK